MYIHLQNSNDMYEIDIHNTLIFCFLHTVHMCIKENHYYKYYNLQIIKVGYCLL